MLTCVLGCWLVLTAGSLAPVVPPQVVLLAGEKDYQTLVEAETTHQGLLERNPNTGVVGASRFNAYRLKKEEAGKAVLLELRLPVRAHLLADHVGQQVRLVGKVVPVMVDG